MEYIGTKYIGIKSIGKLNLISFSDYMEASFNERTAVMTSFKRKSNDTRHWNQYFDLEADSLIYNLENNELLGEGDQIIRVLISCATSGYSTDLEIIDTVTKRRISVLLDFDLILQVLGEIISMNA